MSATEIHDRQLPLPSRAAVQTPSRWSLWLPWQWPATSSRLWATARMPSRLAGRSTSKARPARTRPWTSRRNALRSHPGVCLRRRSRWTARRCARILSGRAVACHRAGVYRSCGFPAGGGVESQEESRWRCTGDHDSGHQNSSVQGQDQRYRLETREARADLPDFHLGSPQVCHRRQGKRDADDCIVESKRQGSYSKMPMVSPNSNMLEFLQRIAEGNSKMSLLLISVKSETRQTRQLVEKEGRLTRDHLDDTLRLQKFDENAEARRQKLLQSLKHPALNARRSEIAETHADTFEWIFDKNLKAGDSMITFLMGQHDLYWVQGKAGSGKSCLMKFLLGYERTQASLQQWIPDQQPIILSHFFWLAGASPLQKNSKGLWSSLLYQLLFQSPDAAAQVQNRPEFDASDSLDDWSPKQLMDTFIRCARASTRPLCVFLDGLDEYESKESIFGIRNQVAQLINVKHEQGTTKQVYHIKLIVSSRPEAPFKDLFRDAPQMALQVLTETDIKKVAQDHLLSARSATRFGPIREDQLDKLLSIIMSKANGVFIWVHYALHRLINDMTFCDTWYELRERLEECPAEMHDLFETMWHRLHLENRARFREEAAEYFHYAMHETDSSSTWRDSYADPDLPSGLMPDFYPYGNKSRALLPRRIRRDFVFDYMIAHNTDLRAKILGKEGTLAAKEILDQCKVTKRHLETRCAGLLEVHEGYPHSGESPISKLAKHFVSRSSNPDESDVSIQGLLDEEDAELCLYASTITVKFIHRTAIDFLREHPKGQSICEAFKTSSIDRVLTIIKVSLARQLVFENCQPDKWTVLEQLEQLEPLGLLSSFHAEPQIMVEAMHLVQESVQSMAIAEAYFGRPQPSTDMWNYPVLALSDSGTPNGSHSLARDFLGLCVVRGVIDQATLQEYVVNSARKTPLTPQYKSYLLLCALAGYDTIIRRDPAQTAALIRWLLAIGANLHYHAYVLRPIDEPRYNRGFMVDLWSTSPFQQLIERALFAWRARVVEPKSLALVEDLLTISMTNEETWTQRIPVIFNGGRPAAFSLCMRPDSPNDYYDPIFLVVEVNLVGLCRWYRKTHAAEHSRNRELLDFNNSQPFQEVAYVVMWEESSTANTGQGHACWWRPSSKDSELMLSALERCPAIDLLGEDRGRRAAASTASFRQFEAKHGPWAVFQTLVAEVLRRSKALGCNSAAVKDWRQRGWLAPEGCMLNSLTPFQSKATGSEVGKAFKAFSSP